MEDKKPSFNLANIPFGYAYHKIIVDEQGTPTDYEFLEVNPAFERITGLKAKEIIGKTVCQILPGIREDNFDWVQYYGNIAIDGGESEFEQYAKPLHSWYKVQVCSDQKYYFSAVFIDITAQKSLSDIAATFNNFSALTIDLQYLVDKARELSGAAYAMLNKFDENGRGFSTIAFSDMNIYIEKVISILGFDPRGKTWDYDPERQKKIDNQKTTVFQQLTVLTGKVIPKNIITFLSNTFNIGQVAVVKTTRENTMLGDFTLFFERGSQLKNREIIETYADLTGMLLSRIDEERKVRIEQARFKTITDNVSDLVWESDLQFINTFTSPSVHRILGFSIEEYTSQSLVERLSPESIQIALSILQEELEKENDPHVNKSRTRLVELEYYKKDGRIILLESNIGFVRDESGKPIGLRGVSRDISERKRAEKELIQAKEKAEESDRLKSAFLANMSHEIRTPMNGILGFAGLLKRADLKSENRQKYIEIIEQSGKRMLNIINDIVDISKIEVGLIKPDMKGINVNAQIEYVCNFFKPEAETKKVQLSYRSPLSVREATIITDREKVYSILTNLVKNAIKYTEEGAIELGYDLKLDAQPGMLEFYVKDSGIGIPKERQEAIFERFVQADIADTRTYEGSGLGLAITKSYVEMLGGNIWVESEEGKGSTFYFTLPYKLATAMETTGEQ
ncbi:MAG: PAS domain S-box protein [Bacteroidales bacterium]|nr:PAS domain S-box protein [Bacteroidales bacterium]